MLSHWASGIIKENKSEAIRLEGKGAERQLIAQGSKHKSWEAWKPGGEEAKSSPVKYAALVFFEEFNPGGIGFAFHRAGGASKAEG